MINLPITGVKVFFFVSLIFLDDSDLISHCTNNFLIPSIAGLSNNKTNINYISNDRESDSTIYLQLSLFIYFIEEKNSSI
jgi:hypothetical protein